MPLQMRCDINYFPDVFDNDDEISKINTISRHWWMIDKQWKKVQASRCCTADVCLHQYVNQLYNNKKMTKLVLFSTARWCMTRACKLENDIWGWNHHRTMLKVFSLARRWRVRCATLLKRKDREEMRKEARRGAAIVAKSEDAIGGRNQIFLSGRNNGIPNYTVLS